MKALLAVLLAACGLAAQTPILLYEFDEGSGSTITDTSTGTTVDLTIGDTSLVRWGPGYLDFLDGDPRAESAVNAAAHIANAVQTADAMTIELWVTPADTTQVGPARMLTMSQGPNARNFTAGHGVYLNDGRPEDVYSLRFTTTAQPEGHPNGGNVPYYGTAGDVRAELQHVVWTYDGTAGVVLHFIDGQQVGLSTNNVAGLLSQWVQQFKLVLGNEDGAPRAWQGRFHKVAVYASALSGQQINTLFAAGSGDPDDARFELLPETDASAFYDASGNLSAKDFQYRFTNASTTETLDFKLTETSGWLSIDTPATALGGGIFRLTPGEVSKMQVTLDAAAIALLDPGTYEATILFDNDTHAGQDVTVTVRLAVLPTSGVNRIVVPERSRTIWNPGLYEGIPDDANGYTLDTTVGGATQQGSTLSPLGGTTDDSAQIQAAINAAEAAATRGARKFVQLGAGTFHLDSVLTIDSSYVTLRGTITGTGTDLDPFVRATILDQDFSGDCIVISGGSGTSWDTPTNATGVQTKGASTIVVDSAVDFSVGDWISIDHLTDGTFWGPAGGAFTRNGTTPTGAQWAYVSSNFYQRQAYDPDGDPGTNDGRGLEPFFPDSPIGGGGVEGYRHISQVCEILAIDGTTLTIWDPDASNGVVGAPLHQTFYHDPEVYVMSGTSPHVQFCGLEDLVIWGSAADGKRMVFVNKATQCWIHNVETNGSEDATGNVWSGRHIQLGQQTARCEVSRCYVHESSNYRQGANAYGIVVSGSDNLVCDNVCVTLNKPIVCENTRGGCVISYNFVENAIIVPGGDNPATGVPYPNDYTEGFFQEAAISTHASVCQTDLFEGNWSPNITVDSTHGTNADEVIFRNHCTGRNASGFATTYERAVSSDGWQWEVASIGNVLWSPATVAQVGGALDFIVWTPATTASPVFAGPEHVYLIGTNAFVPGTGPKRGADSADDGFALAHFHRHLDAYYAASGVPSVFYVNPENPHRPLPDSLYLTSAPSFFTAVGFTWPWVDPAAGDYAAQVLQLPARERWLAGNP